MRRLSLRNHDLSLVNQHIINIVNTPAPKTNDLNLNDRDLLIG